MSVPPGAGTVSEPQPPLVSDPLADELARHEPALLMGLVEALHEELPGAQQWSQTVREAVRGSIAEVLEGFLRFLRVGDLEAHDCERLRVTVNSPMPGVDRTSGQDVVRMLRIDLVELAAWLLGDRLTPERRRLLDQELERYLSLLQPPSLHLAGLGELDSWLARIAAAGQDLGGSSGEGDGGSDGGASTGPGGPDRHVGGTVASGGEEGRPPDHTPG